MRNATRFSAFGWGAPVALLLAAAVGCDTGAPKVQYEYIYREGPSGVAVPAASQGAGRLPLSFDGVPKRGAPNPKVVIVEVSDFQ